MLGKKSHVNDFFNIIGFQLIVATVNDIIVVQNFLDIFPKYLAGIPLDRLVEFTINLVYGTTPVSKVPHSMVLNNFKS